jgi:hypothetical protein
MMITENLCTFEERITAGSIDEIIMRDAVQRIGYVQLICGNEVRGTLDIMFRSADNGGKIATVMDLREYPTDLALLHDALERSDHYLAYARVNELVEKNEIVQRGIDDPDLHVLFATGDLYKER